MAERRRRGTSRRAAGPPPPTVGPANRRFRVGPAASEAALRLLVRTLEGAAPTEHLYERLFGGAENSFWLDSADAPTWLGRSSYLGTSAGRGSSAVEYEVDAGRSRSTARATTRSNTARSSTSSTASWRGGGAPPAGVERGLVGGYVGYLGYE